MAGEYMNPIEEGLKPRMVRENTNCECCNDDRFSRIEKVKQLLIENTNIETSPEEMDVIDNILFRFWQMGWIDLILDNRITIHDLKILPKYYVAVKEGAKNFELRYDDRGYKVHDIVRLRAWDGKGYLDWEPIEKSIKYVLRDCPKYGLENGYVIIGF